MMTVKLMDTGNLVLMRTNDTSAEDEIIVWESFSNPTDTFLPGMLMDGNLQLISWKSGGDPRSGNFTFDGNYEQGVYQIISGKHTRHWKSDESANNYYIAYGVRNLLSNVSINSAAGCGRDARGKPYPACSAKQNISHEITRLEMSFTGEIQYLEWDDKNKNWSLIWWAPKDKCGALNACGKFGSCNSNNEFVYKCLPGFQPSSSYNWNSGHFSGGCIRKSQLCAGETETFLSLKMMNVRDADTKFEVKDETECKTECIHDCNCQAYSYVEYISECWIWTEDLTNLQEYTEGGRNISVRVILSDIELTARDCETCGTNMIPYPLSTGPKCGDPMYFSFQCDNSTGQVGFKVSNASYRVTDINPSTRKFFIEAKDAGHCEVGNSTGTILQLNKRSPFHVNNSCNINASAGNFSSNEVEIYWDPPPEPTCTSSIDCKDWPNSTCKYSTQDGKKRCLCNVNFGWNHSSLNCTQEGRPSHEPNNKKISKSLIIAVTFISLIVLIAFSCTIFYNYSNMQRRRVAERQRNQMQHLYDTETRVKDLIESDQFGEGNKKEIDVPFFDLKTILVATDNFSDANMLGRGGSGTFYKGKLLGGQEIAVKRLSNISGQGLEEFKNEVILIAKLQHRNLVKLLGYCIKGEEKILLYEYMPNKSLDSFIFDQSLCMLLHWELRFNIILGIARGLLYLHQDSRLRIIHRDLKTSNILLDKDLNPKISDFGLARIFEGKQLEASTYKIVGTYGYMSPEYANYGFFSVKSDVFSFGVVVLEIITGKRVKEFYQSDQTLSLLGLVWRLWNEDKAMDLMDEALCESCNANEFLKCVNIGLLCVQENPSDRPTMSNVLVMLESETVTLSTPKQPAFIVREGPCSTASSSSKLEACSNNEMSITEEGGR